MPAENFTAKIIGKNFNDSTVIGVAGKSYANQQWGFADSTMLKASDLTNDRVSLGMLSLFENAKIVNVPVFSDALKNSNKILVPGMGGSFEYEVAMDIDKPIVVQDVEEGDHLGIDESTFCIKLSHPYSPGDILTYDPIDGVSVIVIEDAEVQDEGDGFVHTVKLFGRDRTAWFPKEKLTPGTEFCKIDHLIGEFGTQYSAPDVSGMSQSKVKLLYTLGDLRGVQIGLTAYAKTLTINGKESQALTDRINNMKAAYGGAEYFFVSKMNKAGEVISKKTQLQPIMEGLAMAELYKLTALGMMYNPGGTVTGINGTKKANEGLYHQLRRGHRFTYTNISELRALILRAADVIYQGTNIPIEKRMLKFKAGYDAYNLVREMFRDEWKNNTPIHVDQNSVPVPILDGSDRYNLNFRSFAIGTAFLAGIGNVEVIHDPSLDYDPWGDYLERGYNAGRSKRSWTLVMWDITDPMYSNVYDKSALPKGVTIDEKSKGNPNLYIVKPEGMPDFVYGRSDGFQLTAGHQYNRSQMGSEFTCASAMSGWIPDKGRVVLIEKLTTTEF